MYNQEYPGDSRLQYKISADGASDFWLRKLINVWSRAQLTLSWAQADSCCWSRGGEYESGSCINHQTFQSFFIWVVEMILEV